MKYDPDRSARPRPSGDVLDGCACDMQTDLVPDAELAYVALAGGRSGVGARERIEEYGRILGGAQ